jgi:HK97 family phage portal protein
MMSFRDAAAAVLARASAALVTKRAPLNAVGGRGDGWVTLGNWSGEGDLEPFDWQRNIRRGVNGALQNPIVFACLTLVAGDLGKMRAKLMEQDGDGIWNEVRVPAFSPFLRKPNDYQTWQKFIESWVLSKMSRGNAYSLKERDGRGVVTAAHVLDPDRCHPLVSDSGEVFYELMPDDLAKVPDGERIIAPASEVMHDRAWCLFHPLVGLPPLFASALAADQGLKIMLQSKTFFGNMSRPSGTLTTPGFLTDDQALIYKNRWNENYGPGKQGQTAILGNGLVYTPLAQTAEDSQLVEQLKLTDERICSTFHVPPYKVGVGAMPPYQSAAILDQIYYDCCLQTLIVGIQSTLNEGLGLASINGKTYQTELDLDDLLKMDEGALTEVLAKQVGGIAKINEARKRLNLPPVTGGDTVYLQQQNYSLAALAKRDAKDDPFGAAAKPAPAGDLGQPMATPKPVDGAKAVAEGLIKRLRLERRAA